MALSDADESEVAVAPVVGVVETTIVLKTASSIKRAIDVKRWEALTIQY